MVDQESWSWRQRKGKQGVKMMGHLYYPATRNSGVTAPVTDQHRH